MCTYYIVVQLCTYVCISCSNSAFGRHIQLVYIYLHTIESVRVIGLADIVCLQTLSKKDIIVKFHARVQIWAFVAVVYVCGNC